MGNAYERALRKQEPYWLRGSPMVAAARARDAADALFKEAVSIRCPAFCPEDGRYHLGVTRGLEQAPGELAADFIARCGTAHDDAYWWGTPHGFYLDVFRPLGVAEADLYVLDDHETSFGFYPELAWYSRVWFIVESAAGPWTDDGLWDDPGTWDDGGVWDCSITVREIAFIRRRMRKIKWVGAYPAYMFIVLDPSDTDGDGVWDGVGTWGDGGVWDASTLATAKVVPIVIGHLWDEETLIYGGAPAVWDEPGDTWDGFE